jgi:penicillin-binding protein 1A
MPHYFPVSKKRKKTNIFFRFLLALIGIGVLAGVGGIGYVYFAYFRDMPSITDIEKNILPESTIIYDRNGKELYKLFSKEKRTYVPYAAISPRMIDAIVSIEDKTFFENPGIDLK